MDWISYLQSHVSPAFSEAVAVIVIAYLGLLGVARLFDIWRSFRARRAILEEEKLFNEILKLRYEIEVLRKVNQLPDLTAPALAEGAAAARAGTGPGARTAGLLHLHVGMPDLPSLAPAPVLSALRFTMTRPPPGSGRALWAIKWLIAPFVLFVLVGLATDRGLPVGFLGLAAVLCAFAMAYLLVMALYNVVLAVRARVARSRRDSGGST